MQRNLLVTDDGSHTIEVPELNVSYHSRYGAIQESLHVFIEAGFKHIISEQQSPDPVRIFEMGFGTGLNALLTLISAGQHKKTIYYETIEAFPPEEHLALSLNYCEQLQRPDLASVFHQLHICKWNTKTAITPFFQFKKTNTTLQNFSTDRLFHLIYYDAFAPNAQPELWTEAIFKKLYRMLEPGGALVTYCSKGDVRRAMQVAGFAVEKLKGPPGKREMLRGAKFIS